MSLDERTEARYMDLGKIVIMIATVIVAWCLFSVSQDQLAALRFANRKQLRPYLLISKTQDSLYSKKQLVPAKGIIPQQIWFDLRNSGQTPAYNVRIRGGGLD